MIDRLRAWRDSPSLLILRLLPGVDRARYAVLAAIVVLGGLLPTVSIIASGTLVTAVPGAVHDGLGSSSGHDLLTALTVVVVAFAASQTAGQLASTLATSLGARLDRDLQQRVMRAVATPVGVEQVERPATRDLISRALGVSVARFTPGGAVNGISSNAVQWLQALSAAALLLPYRWWLGCLLVAVQIWSASVQRRHYLRQAKVLTQQTGLMRRSAYFRDLAMKPDAAKEIRLFGLASWVVERFHAEWLAGMRQVWTERTIGLRLQVLVLVSVGALNFAAYAFVGSDAISQAINLGTATMLLRAIQRIGTLSTRSSQDFQIVYGATSVPAVIQLERELATARTGGGAGRPSSVVPGSVLTLEGVSYSYPGAREPVLRGVDLDLPTGRSLAIVGENGAGKTTLVKLLCRLYDPGGGRLVLNGIDLHEIDARAWQRGVAAIFQDFVHYELSVRDNIAFGAVEQSANKEMLEHAAERAGILERINALPNGWDTPLARHLPGGVELSGGQWQRIALARALFAVNAGARLLVMDEPTAHLDVRAEAEFYDRFLELTGGVTTVLISHRFATVRKADRICVVADGRIVELGSHDELMAAGGRYQEMFTLQSARFAEATNGGQA